MTDCPALTRITAETIAITKDLVTELRVSTYDTSPGTQVDVTCQFDLQLVGPSTVTCGNNGQWSATPSCIVPEATTTPSESSGLDESTILLIVLGVVVAFVVAVIVIICIALYRGKLRKRQKEKSQNDTSLYGDDSLPYTNTISERVTSDTNNVAMYNIYKSDRQLNDKEDYRRAEPDRKFEDFYRYQPREHRDDQFGDKKQYRYYRSHDDVYNDRSFRFHELHMDEPYENPLRRRDTNYQHPGRLYEKNTNISGSPPARRRRYTPRCPHCNHASEMKHAQSADDILSDREEVYDKDERQGPSFRRDHYLWRSMNAISDWRVPRPYYAN